MPRLRLVTFNLAHGRGLTPVQGFTSARKLRANLRRIATLLGKLAPDVVALQEVDECSRWAGNFDHLDYLRAHAGFPHSVFGIHNRLHGLIKLSYGNALLSRHPILASETVAFGLRPVGEKGFLFAELDLAGQTVPLVNAHLHATSRARRLAQASRLADWLTHRHTAHARRWSVPPIVCGDFNNPSTAPDATASLLSHLGHVGSHSHYALYPPAAGGATFPSPLPRRALDFVLVPGGCRVVHCEVVRTLLSDHCPVLVELEFG